MTLAAVRRSEAKADPEVREKLVRLGEHYDRRKRRKQSDPLEIAGLLSDLIYTHRVSRSRVAESCGMSLSAISQYTKLYLSLPPDLKRHVAEGRLPFKAARGIAAVEDPDVQRRLARLAMGRRLTASSVEWVAVRARRSPELPLEALVEEAGEQPGRRMAPAAREAGAEAEVPRSNPDGEKAERQIDLNTAMISLAGHLIEVTQHPVPEFRKGRLASSMKILRTKLEVALGNLNGPGPGDEPIPSGFAPPGDGRSTVGGSTDGEGVPGLGAGSRGSHRMRAAA